MADDTGSQSLLGQIAGSALSFATPFAQRVFGSSSTPQTVQNDTLRTAALNGSGPNDPTLASQSPLGLWDFITGGRVTGSGSTSSGQGGLTGGTNLTFIGIVVIAIVAVVVILKR